MRRNIAVASALGLAGCAVAGAAIAPRDSDAPEASVRAQGAPTVTQAAARSRALTCRLRRRRFQTLPGLRPTPFCVAVRRGAAVSGDAILVTPRPDPRRNPHEQFGLMLVSSDGKLLWYRRRPAKVHDLKAV